MNKSCRVLALRKLVVGHSLILPLSRGEAFEAFIAAKTFTPLSNLDFRHRSSGSRSERDFRLGC